MSTPATPRPIEPGDAGHQHLCRRDHYWQHAGPTAEGCALPTRQPHTARLSEADCAVCAGRDDLLTRPRHSHRCTFCEVQWIHEGRCAEGLAAWCPWDFAGSSGETAPGTRIGRHLHHCPNCGTHWAHLEPCAAQWQVALSSCPGCGTPPQRSAGRLWLEAWQASRGPGAASRHRSRRSSRRRARPRAARTRSPRTGDPGRFRGTARWVLVGGVAAIILVTLEFLPINSADWWAPARPLRIPVAPLPSAERATSASPQAVPAPPVNPRASAPGEGHPGVEETAASEAPGDREARYRDRLLATPDEVRSRAAQGQPRHEISQQPAAHPRPESGSTPAPAVGDATTPSGPPVALPTSPVGSDYPTKPVQLMVAYPAGGSTDVAARIVAAIAEKELGQPVLRQNAVPRAGRTFPARPTSDGPCVESRDEAVDCGRLATRGTGRAVSTAENAPRGAMTGVPGSAGLLAVLDYAA